MIETWFHTFAAEFVAADLATEIHISFLVFLVCSGFGFAVYGIVKVIRLMRTEAEAFRKE